MEPLQEELLKLTEVAPNPPDASFLLGYLACALPREAVAAVRAGVRQLLGLQADGLISALNVLQLLAVLRLRVLPGARRGEEGGRAAAELQTLAGELVCDNGYLQARYFEAREAGEAGEGEAAGLCVECAICTVEIAARELCYLSCAHMYHRACFEGYAREKISRKALPLRCPAEECGAEVLAEEVGEYLSR